MFFYHEKTFDNVPNHDIDSLQLVVNMEEEQVVFCTLEGEESIQNFSSLEVINSEIIVSQSDVVYESNKDLNYDASNIGDKTFFSKTFQECTKLSLEWNDELDKQFDGLCENDQPTQNEKHPFLFTNQQEMFPHVFKDPLANLLESLVKQRVF